MFSFFKKAAHQLNVCPYVGFQKMFQLYSSLYAPFDPASMPDDSVDNPLALVKGVAMGINQDVSDRLEDPETIIKNVHFLRNENDDWVVHGEYQTPEDSRLFMMMFGTNHVTEEGELETYYIPYFIFDSLIANTDQDCFLHPETVVTGIQTDKDEVLYSQYAFPREFGMALCFADAAFCQILANQPVDMRENQRWVSEYPDFQRAQKIAWMRERDFDTLRTQITGQAAGRVPVSGLALKHS